MKNRSNNPHFAVPDSYLSLVKRFPIRELRGKAEHKQALAIVRELMLRGDDHLDAGEIDYLRALSRFIADFEKDRFTVRPRRPLDVLKCLMELHQMTSGDLARIIGSHSAASMILHGKREMSKTHIRALAEHFALSPAMFI